MIKAEGAWAPRLRLDFSRQCRGLKIGLWVPGAVGRDQDGHWSLGSRAVTSRKSCLLPPWLFCPGDGMGCAGSSSRSGAAWLGARGSPPLPVCCLLAIHGSLPLLGKLQRHITRTIICADICRDKEERPAYKRMYAMRSTSCFVSVVMCYVCMYAHPIYCLSSPGMEVQIDAEARLHRSCPSCRRVNY